MPSLDEAVMAELRAVFLAAGFEQMPDRTLWRLTFMLHEPPPERHNIFVSLTPDGIEVMSPVGPVAGHDDADFGIVRDPADGYELIRVGENACLRRPLNSAAVSGRTELVVEEAVMLAEYAGKVELLLAENAERRRELVYEVFGALEDPGFFSTSPLSSNDMCDHVDELLFLVPQRELWATLQEQATHALAQSWASSSGTLRDNPWNAVVTTLERIGRKRQWA